MKRIVVAISTALALAVCGMVPAAEAAVAGDWQFDHVVGPVGTFNQPVDITRDAAGNLFVADPADHRIVEIAPSGGVSATFGSSGTGDGQFGSSGPDGVAVDAAGNVFGIDASGYRIEKFSSSGVFLARFGSMGSGNGQFSIPAGITTDAAGNVFVSDRVANRVQKFSNTGAWIATFGSTGAGPGQVNGPRGLAVDAAGQVYVADYGNGRIQVFASQDGTTYAFDRQIGTYGTGVENLAGPLSVKLDPAGNLYVVNFSVSRVQVYSPQGGFVAIIADAKTPPPGTDIGTEAIATDGAGTVWTTDVGNETTAGTVRAYRQYTTPVFTLAPDATAVVGQPYSSAVGATAFPAPTYSVTSGALPAGLALAATGGITGTPTTAGVFTATVAASTPYASASTTVTITVTGAATPTPASPAAGAGTGAGTSAAASAGTVAIAGTPAIGRSLRAVLTGWLPGSTFTYQWTRSGKSIAGSTAATRHLTKGDLDKRIAVIVRANGGALVATSPAVTAGHPFTKIAKPTVRGIAKVGATLRLTKGTWSPKPHTSVRWYRDGVVIPKATKTHYRLGKADAGARITVTVTATKKHYATTTSTSVRTARVKTR